MALELFNRASAAAGALPQLQKGKPSNASGLPRLIAPFAAITALVTKIPVLSVAPHPYMDPSYPKFRNVGLIISIREIAPTSGTTISSFGFPMWKGNVPVSSLRNIRRFLPSPSSVACEDVIPPAFRTALGSIGWVLPHFPFPQPPLNLQTILILNIARDSVQEPAWIGRPSNMSRYLSLRAMACLLLLARARPSSLTTSALARTLSGAAASGAGASAAPASSATDALSFVSETTESDSSASSDLDSDAESDGGEDGDSAAPAESAAKMPVVAEDGSPSLTDLALMTRSAEETVPMAFVGPRHATVGALMPASAPPPRGVEAFQPARSEFIPLLQKYYQDPLPTASETFKDAFKAKSDMSLKQFTEMRGDMLSDHVGQVIIHTDVIGERAVRSYTICRADFLTAVEMGLADLLAEGIWSLPPEGDPIFLAFIWDAGGKKVNQQRLSHGLVIPGRLSSYGRLRCTITLFCHFGYLSAAHRLTLMGGEIGKQLCRLSTGRLHGRRVLLTNLSDWSDATKFYSTPSLYPANSLVFLTAAAHGVAWFVRRGCGGCTNTAAEIWCVPSIRDLARRIVPPDVRGCPDLRMPMIYLRLHALIHGLPPVLADIACRLKARGHTAAAEVVSGVFPDTTWAPLRDPADPPPVKEALSAAQKEEADCVGGYLRRIVASRKVEEAPRAGGAGAGDEQQKGRKQEAAPPRPPPGEASGGPRVPAHAVLPRSLKEALASGLDGPLGEAVRAIKETGDSFEYRDADGTIVVVVIADFLGEVIEYFNIVWHPQQNGITTMADVERVSRQGRRLFQTYKYMLRDTYPLDLDKLVARIRQTTWAARMGPEAAEMLVRRFWTNAWDYNQSAAAITTHMAFEHVWDVFHLPGVDFDTASGITEEAGDHLFVYYYYTVPRIFPRSLTGSANALRTWQVMTEASAVGFPSLLNKELDARIRRNRAYS